jgi:hypothetical protein
LRNHKPTPFLGDYFISLTNNIMGNFKKIAAIAAAIGLVVVVGMSGVFQAQTTYASHLENAEKALQELQLLQNSGEEVNQARVQELIQEVVNETNAAFELAKKEHSGEGYQGALMEIKAVQTKSITMFQKYEGEDNEAVKQMLQETNQQHERVMQMLGEQSGETVREQNHLENAEQTLNQLQKMQQEGEEKDPEQVRELTQKVVQEMNSALDMAEQKQEAEQKQHALQEVQAVQEKAMNMFSDLEGEAAQEAIQRMEQQQERTRNMLGEQAGAMVQEQTMEQNKMYSGQ